MDPTHEPLRDLSIRYEYQVNQVLKSKSCAEATIKAVASGSITGDLIVQPDIHHARVTMRQIKGSGLMI